MWIISSMCLLVGSAFVVPPTSSLLHPVPHAVVPQFSALRRCRNDMRMAVADDDFPEIKNIFVQEDYISSWLKERKPSVVEKLKRSLLPGNFDDEAWQNLLPSDYQDSLADKDNSSEVEDFATFFDCAKRALQSVHENNEIGLDEEALAKNFCLWVESLRAMLVSTMVCDEPTEGVPDPPFTEPPIAVDGDHAKEEASAEKKTIIAVVEDARKLARTHVSTHGPLTQFLMTLTLDPEDFLTINLLKDHPVFSKQSQSDGSQLYLGSENCTMIALSLLRKGETDSQIKNLFPDQDNMVKAEAARKAFVALGLSEKTNRDLVEELVDNIESSLTLESTYRDKLVDLSETKRVRFAKSPGKSRVIIVAGESGSGKTTFAQYGLKRLAAGGNLTCTAVIYHSLDKEAGNKFKVKEEEDLSDEDVVVRMLISQILRRFKDSHGEEGITDSAEEAAYKFVGSLSSVLNKERNELALGLFKDSMKRFFAKHEGKEVKEWWEGRRPRLVLDGLIIVLDETGRDRKLVRGLVDIGRDLVGGVVQGAKGSFGLPPRAKNCMIALAGAGLDVVDESFQEAFDITDPDKADIVIAKRVDFNSPDFAAYLGEVKSEEILQGTISSVLAENTRMLAEAILPSFNSDPLTQYYETIYEEKNYEIVRTEHRIAAGSSRFFMNYAARLFVDSNGLRELDPDDIELIFQDAFRFFLLEAVKAICDEEVFLIASARKSLLKELSRKEIDERIFFFGVANRGQATSRAMMFLSCLGSAFALVDGDGLLFEKALSVHLARLSTCLGRNHVGTYELKASLPTTQRKFSTKSIGDVKRIAKMVNDGMVLEKGPWSLIITQGTTNPPGPDTMELQLYPQGNGGLRGVLDLYQSKYTKDSHTAGTLMDAAVTLGRSPTDMGLKDISVRKEKRVRNAPAVRDCLDKFVKKLEEELGIENAIAIGKRIIVIKPPAKPGDLKKSTNVVLGGGVTVWTSEFLEPTCSLFNRSRKRQFE